jgi:cholesterol oxidase
MPLDFDYVVIGSGFGGSVSALRLAEKGYSVCIIERGKHWRRSKDFAETNWQFWKWLWAPKLFSTGIQNLTFLKNVLALSGSGVGGGSLVYCAVLLEPPRPFYDDPQWKDLQPDWQSTLAPFYKKARKMLGVTENPKLWKSDELLNEYAHDIGREAYFKPTEVGIYFGDADQETPDPFFDGDGPARKGCNFSGRCMVGCRNGGKNSLDRNYLYLAEKLGTKIIPETNAVDIQELENGGYRIDTAKSTGWFGGRKKSITARGVIVSAGALGTTKLLLKCKQNGSLPNLSKKLGQTVRTNSEVLAGATSNDKDANFSEGISITSSLFVNDTTHIEPVRYPAGSDLMFWLSTLATSGGTRLTRPLKFIGNIFRHPVSFFRSLVPFGWAKRSIILLVMQTLDNRLNLSLKRKWYWPFTKTLSSSWQTSSIPSYIPEANHAAAALAKKINGRPSNAVTEVLLNMPLSAHILGGCVMAENSDAGVIDKQCRAFGYDNFYIIDGSAVSANLGVNPSLTITALAEYAMDKIPEKNEDK